MLNVTLHQVAEFKENATARKDVQDRLQEGKSSPKFQREAAFNSGHISTVARRDGSTAERACQIHTSPRPHLVTVGPFHAVW